MKRWDSKLARFAFSKYELRKCSHYSDHATFAIKYNSTNPKHKYIQDFQTDLKHNYLRLRRSVSYYYLCSSPYRKRRSKSISINQYSLNGENLAMSGNYFISQLQYVCIYVIVLMYHLSRKQNLIICRSICAQIICELTKVKGSLIPSLFFSG